MPTMARAIATCCREMTANVLMSIPPVARLRVRAGRTSAAPSGDQLRRYAFSLILDNPIIQPLIRGARVLEIGPGDHLATGLTLLAYGAASYTAIDRFQGAYRSTSARQWYALVRERWAEHFDSPWPADLESFPDVERVSTIAARVEDLQALPESAYDLVVSQAVGEHVLDIEAFAAGTYRLLRNGGTAMHNIDFSCHGFFQSEPLYFLTIPDAIWRLMGSNRGLPNRKRVHEFEASFRSLPFASVEVIARTLTDHPIPAGLGADSESLRTTWASFVLRK